MATGKRYYWLKLKDTFMSTDGAIDYLMSQPNGANYVVLYQMLCLKTINTEGRLSQRIGEIIIPYDVEKIQRDCRWFSLDTVRVGLTLFTALGLVYEDQDGTLVITDHQDLIGSETDWSEKKRRQRLEQGEQASLPVGKGGDIVPTDVPQIVPIEIRDKILDINNISGGGDDDLHPSVRERVCACVRREWGREPTVGEVDALLALARTIDIDYGEDAIDLLDTAINAARGANVMTTDYVFGVFRNFKERGIKTIDALMKYEMSNPRGGRK